MVKIQSAINICLIEVDGDKSLVVSDKTIIDVAERNIKKFVL